MWERCVFVRFPVITCTFLYVLFVCTVPQPAVKNYLPMFTVIIRKWPCWTRAQSSTSLCKRRFHPERKETKTQFQHRRTVQHSFSLEHVIFLWLHKNNDKTAYRRQFQHKAYFSNISVTACYLFNLYLTRTVSWDWHILFFFKTPGKQITTWQPRAASDGGNLIHLKGCQCPDVSLLPLWEPHGSSRGGIPPCLMMEQPCALEIPRCSSEGRRACLPNCLPQVKTMSTFKTKPEPSLCIKLVSAEQKSGCHIP